MDAYFVAPEDSASAGGQRGSTAAGEGTHGGSGNGSASTTTTTTTASTPAPPTTSTTTTSAIPSSSSNSNMANTITSSTTDNHNNNMDNNNNNNSQAPVLLTTVKKAWSLEEANEEIALLLEGGKVTMTEVSALQGLMRDYGALQDKVGKLKSLLGRSAKAQREAKVDLEATQKRLDQALREVERLQSKVDVLANRPTHMDLLADFETNFDRALLSVGQAGGQDTAAPTMMMPSRAPPSTVEQLHQHHNNHHHHHHTATSTSPHHRPPPESSALVDSMLMQELAEQKNRIDRLEALNTALLHRSSQLEHEAKQFLLERDQAQQQLSRMQLELRMAKMEADHATRALHDKAASLAEMQMEIDLVVKASLDAQKRAAQGEAAAKSHYSDKQYVQQLESQVQALQEWALASAESKRLATEHVQILERKLQQYETAYLGQQQQSSAMFGNNNNSSMDGSGSGDNNMLTLDHPSSAERIIMSKSGSLVIGAGDVGCAVIEITPDHIDMVDAHERVVLRWKFDLTNPTLGIDFSMLKGKCDVPTKQQTADTLIPVRAVMGGAGGETELAFAIQNACTLLWSNAKSWVRPRTVKYIVEAVAVPNDDV